MEFKNLMDLINSYQLALATMSFDAATIAPKDGSSYRNKAMAILAGELFNLLISEKTIAILEASASDEDELIRKNASYLLKDLEKIKDVPQDVYVRFENLKNDAQDIWAKARETNDYSLYEPCLNDLIAGFREIMSYRHDNLKLYDLALDDYEDGLRQTHVDTFFAALEPLIPFMEDVLAKQEAKPAWAKISVAAEKQSAIAQLLMEHLNYKPSFGLLAETEHPFSSTFSIGDTRISTHYYEDNFISSIFSVIHEIGHSMYNHQVNPAFEGLPYANNMSYSMHESQSRLLENMIGRSRAFWVPLYPKLQAIIPDLLENVALDEFIRVINYVEKGYIRTEADELSYPLHILVRYNVEKAIFANEEAIDVRQCFNQEMKRVLDLDIVEDGKGVLQDVHWSGASFGYFPSYALGSAYAAQFYHAMNQELDINTLLEKGDLAAIFSWLKENIHQYSGSILTQDLIEQVSGKAFNPDYYIDYLKDKYSRLSGIR